MSCLPFKLAGCSHVSEVVLQIGPGPLPLASNLTTPVLQPREPEGVVTLRCYFNDKPYEPQRCKLQATMPKLLQQVPQLATCKTNNVTNSWGSHDAHAMSHSNGTTDTSIHVLSSSNGQTWPPHDGASSRRCLPPPRPEWSVPAESSLPRPGCGVRVDGHLVWPRRVWRQERWNVTRIPME